MEPASGSWFLFCPFTKKKGGENMCGSSHGQTASHCCEKKQKSCPQCENAKLEKTRRAMVEARPQNPDEVIWYCSKCGWLEPVE